MRKKLLASLLIGTGAMLALPVVAMAERSECCPSLEVILTGGWFAADGANTAYAIDRTDTLNGGTTLGTAVMPSGDLERVDPKYKWGGGIALAYQGDCCYNWGASYFWYHHTSNDNVTAGTLTNPAVGAVLIPPAVAGNSSIFTNGNVLAAASAFKFRYDFANIELGSWICVIADCLKVNPKIGLSYSRIRAHQDTYYSGYGTGSIVTVVESGDEVEMLSRYRGFGPSIGADVVYLFCGDFQLFGNLRYSALVGSLHGEFTNTLDVPGATAENATNSGTVEFHSNRHMVKLFQSELGLGYTFDWCGYCGSIKAGYQLTQALDSVNRVQFLDSNDHTALSNNIINASFHGPFIRLSAKFGM